MSLFRAVFGRAIDQVQTEEDRYRAAVDQQADETSRTKQFEAVNAEASRKYQERLAAREEKQRRVRKVGEIKRVGRGRYVTTGWEIDVPDDSGRGRVVENGVHHSGTLGGFTPAELCAMAHGPRCRRCR